MRPARSVALVLVAAAAVAEPEHPTPRETRAEFEAVCERLAAGDDPFFGRATLADVERRIEASGDPAHRARGQGRLALERLRLGDTTEALALLEATLAAYPAAAIGADLHRRLRWSLATAHMQAAEDANCLEHHAAESCILPLAPAAVHPLPAHARAAGDLYQGLAEETPDDPQLRWLLALARMTTGDYPDRVPEALRLPPDALRSPEPFPRWRNLAPDLGITFSDLAGGAVMDDFDGDGRLDLVTSSWDPCEPLKALRNRGDGGFEDVTAAWGLDAQLGGLNLVHADYDNDRALDLLVLRGGWLGGDGKIRNSLLRNDLRGPSGRFVDVTAAAGVAYPAYPTQTAAWADYDGDGDLDLYVGNESESSFADPLQLIGRTRRPYPSQLFRNEGDGRFTDVARQAGVENRRFAKGVAWGDYDGDGDPDLYVSNVGENRLYRNRGDGTFADVAAEAGVTGPDRLSFATWFFDFDNDGDLDLFVADYSAPVPAVAASYLGAPETAGHPVLYANDGDGTFTDVSVRVGLTRPLLPMGANYGDLDNDGWKDVYLGTGVPDFDALMPNVMYRNDGGERFVDVTFDGGFGHLQKGHGIAFGDLDFDGDQEIYQQLGGAYPYDDYRNVLYDGPAGNARWLVLRLEGRRANRFGVGARVRVDVEAAGTGRSIHELAGSGGSFGGSSLQIEIGLGAATVVRQIEIRWPGSGTVQTFDDVEADRYYRVVEGEPGLEPLAVAPFALAPRARDLQGLPAPAPHAHQDPPPHPPTP